MYTAGTAEHNPAQGQMMQMQMINKGAGIGMMEGPRDLGGLEMEGVNGSFYFVGNSLSLQSRLDKLTDAESEKLADANINVTGT
jgi:hypothetical protein